MKRSVEKALRGVPYNMHNFAIGQFVFVGIHHAKFGDHGYFFSWENEVTENLTVAWLTGRNICRRHCMDLVSLGEIITPGEFQTFINELL